MSEPVTNAEVEDVLSSIRRLVSEDKRPLTASAAAPERRDEAAAKDAAPEQPEGAQDAAAAKPEVSAPATERPFASSRHAPTVPRETPREEAADRLVLTPALRVARPEEPKGAAEADPTPTITPYDYDMLHDDPDDVSAGDAPASAAPEEESAPAFVHARARAAAPEDSVAPDSESDAPQPHAKLSEKIAALETAIGNISEHWEPDSPGDGDYSGTEPPAMAWEDDIEAEETAEAEDFGPDELPRPRAPEPAPDTLDIKEQVRRFADSARPVEPARPAAPAKQPEQEPSTALSGEDQFLDEEALRDLVTEIVRAELQGALGERITRNVRKMVRREVARAMEAMPKG